MSKIDINFLETLYIYLLYVYIHIEIHEIFDIESKIADQNWEF